MNEEEKEAIKVLNNFNPTDCGIEDTQAIETILNLINKQQREIEKFRNTEEKILYTLYAVGQPILKIVELTDCISKDEIRHIRDKAECMDYYSLNDVIDDLSKLLGENEDE